MQGSVYSLLAVLLVFSAAAAAGPTDLVPAGQSATAAPGSLTVTTAAIELRVEGVRTVAEIGGRQARPGYEFVIVDTSWKNIIPLQLMDKTARSPTDVGGLGSFGNNKRPETDPAKMTLEPTAYVVPELKNHLWLLSDERFADTIDAQVQSGVPDHLPPDGFALATFEETLRGTLVFESPASAAYRALQFFDNNHGHALIPLFGDTPPAAPPLLGAVQQNEVMQLGVSEAGFGPAGREAPAGQKYYTVGLRGVSLSPTDIVQLPFSQIVFLQTDRGCVSQPERDISELTRPFGDYGAFIPTAPNEGQVTFLVPDDTQDARLLIVPRLGTSVVLPVGRDFTPAWPEPVQTIEDGSTMRILVLPTPARPAGLPPPEPGREQVLLDVVVENLVPSQGIEFQGRQQLRLADPAGSFLQPLPLSGSLAGQLACALGEMDVVPGGHARRFIAVYDVPAGMPVKLQYRGFEVNEVTVEIE
jgi:hypothetical protein